MLGAKIIEKHFTLNKKLKGNDHYHSMDKKDLLYFNNYLKRLDEISGVAGKNYSFRIYFKKKCQKEYCYDKRSKKRSKDIL